MNNHLLRTVEQWEISDKESCSGNSIIKFAIGQGSESRNKQESQGIKYIVKSENS